MNPKQTQLSYLLCTALEGGSNYWLNNTDEDGNLQVQRVNRDQDGEYLDIRLVKSTVERVSGSKVATTVKLDADGFVLIDFAALTRGLRLIHEGRLLYAGKPWTGDGVKRFKSIARSFLFYRGEQDDIEDYDAGDADVILQAALFGDVVYG